MKKLIHLRQAIASMVAAGWLNKYSVSAGLFIVWMLFFGYVFLVSGFWARILTLVGA